MTLQGRPTTQGSPPWMWLSGCWTSASIPPPMYFPLIVHEALMVEPTETESPETLDQAAQVFLDILAEAKADPESLHQAPRCCPVGRPTR